MAKVKRQTDYTGFGRHMDPRLPSNRFAGLISFIALVALGAAAVMYGWEPWRAFGGAIGVFVAWAIGRELDPDHTATAALASVAALGLAFVAPPDLWVSGAILIAARLVAGTVGARIKVGDVLVLALLGYISGGAVWLWPIGVGILAWLLVAPEVGRLKWSGVGFLVVGFVVAWYVAPIQPLLVDTGGLIAAGAVLLVGLVSLIRCSASARTDARTGTVSSLRIRLARAATTLFTVCAIAGQDLDAFWDVAPAVAAIAATAAISLFAPVPDDRGHRTRD